jgi:NAD(P)-dependent dehydrogenase (short-subunit alcohol dehydrogenase family)
MSDGKVAVVTGAAGSIGGAFVKSLVQEGYEVVAVDISPDRLELLQEQYPGITCVAADVSSREGADATLVACPGRADILCNIAGMGDGLFGADEMTDDFWDRVIAVNLTGSFRLARRLLPLMLEQGSGVIINLSSVAGLRGGRAGAAYTSSKWALIGLTQNIAANLGPEGIRCYAICPGGIEGAVTSGEITYSATGRERAMSRSAAGPIPRGKAEDVAALGMFLISDASHHLNGIAIPLDAGALAN